MAGRSLQEAVRFAGDFVHDAMLVSAEQPDFKDRGVSSSRCWARCASCCRRRHATCQRVAETAGLCGETARFGHDASSKMSSDGVGREGDRPTTFSSSTA